MLFNYLQLDHSRRSSGNFCQAVQCPANEYNVAGNQRSGLVGCGVQLPAFCRRLMENKFMGILDENFF